jgi:hypothetical protein
MSDQVVCQEKRRRDEIRKSPRFNGLDYLEVSDDQRTLTVYFLDKAPREIGRANVRITGGRRVRDIRVMDVRVCRVEDDERDDCMKVLVDRPGDFSTYALCVVAAEQGRPTDRPHPEFDPRYACLEFGFKASCPSDLDCKTEPLCPPEQRDEPEINYLAKDYASFRQLILDRLALVMPEWKERHVPDVGIALVEVLAYIGDHLSYYQDAVATEAYLDTARQRISVRRHARLVDYVLHEGCNARAWVFVEASADGTLEPEQVSFITGGRGALANLPTVLAPEDLRSVPRADYEVFEPMGSKKIRLFAAHNTIAFYTWGERDCCLPRGATSATLLDEWLDSTEVDTGQSPPKGRKKRDAEDKSGGEPDGSADPRPRKLDRLQAGDWLLFEEVRDPKSGNEADANPANRHVVRLSGVTRIVDALYDKPVVEIEWCDMDALPFPLCLSATSEAPECKYHDDISTARGNIVLVDHGRTLEDEDLGSVPVAETRPPCSEVDCPTEIVTRPGHYRPRLRHTPLTFSAPISAHGPASWMLEQDPRHAVAQITLKGDPPGRVGDQPWWPRSDLLSSQPDDRHYVVEIDNEGAAFLRFGDDALGEAPKAGTAFRASYRIGNGPAGNVGAGAISHIVLSGTMLSGLTLTPRNPLPARGGTAPEPLAEVKLFAAQAFRKTLQRAVTAHDYAALVERDFRKRVQRSAAQLRWTGSWYEATVAVDQLGKTDSDQTLMDDIAADLEPYRRIGHDLRITRARHVPLKVTLTVCVLPGHLRGHVKAQLRELLGTRQLPDGRLGFFHPDNLTFGDGIYVSKLVAVARSVAGVENAVVHELQRYGERAHGEIESGVLPLGPFEVARLDSDPNAPEQGVLELNMVGGR